MKPLPLLYDRDCRVCRTLMAGVLTWDRERRLRPVAIQSREADRLLGPMPADSRMDSWHLVTPAGMRSGGAAFPDLLAVLPGGGPAAALARRAPGVSERAYRLVAGHRGSLSRAVPATLQRRADALIARR